MRAHCLKRTAPLLAAVLLLAPPSVTADTEYLPHVSAEMADPQFWAALTPSPDEVLADAAQIEAMNAAALACPDCCMIDLTRDWPAYDGAAMQRELAAAARRDLSARLGSGYFKADGTSLTYEDVRAVAGTVADAPAKARQEVLYGICTELAGVRAAPTDMIITDEAGDLDFDVLQLSNLRVNDPVIVKGRTADGEWYYCDTVCVSGWVRAAQVAVCADRQEWLDAWQIPSEEALVITRSRLYLDLANVNSASSGRKLTMGTVLRRVAPEEYDAALTNRAPYHNYAVWLPVRTAEGAYGVTVALVPEQAGVSEGFLPLTAANLLDTAFTALGEAYGWGGMLDVPDCSLFVRNLYKCFGLELPRNTTWQSAMPAAGYALTGMRSEDKAAVLDTLLPGAVLFFRGHEMLYLGAYGGMHYVLSSVSSIMAPGGGSVLRVRSVIVNTLEDTWRGSGKSWLEDLDLAQLPWLPEGAEEDLPGAA